MTSLESVRGEVVSTLAENEAVIRRGLVTFVEVGTALAAIRDERQFITAGFDTFEDYCKQRLDFAPSTAAEYIGGARVQTLLAQQVRPGELPNSLKAVKPLIAVVNEHGADAAVEAWQQITERHKGDDPISSREVRQFFTIGANYNKPGWFELLGRVGDTLAYADKHLQVVEDALTREPGEAFQAKAGEFAARAEALARRLRSIEKWEGIDLSEAA